jgi:hypothetical protein
MPSHIPAFRVLVTCGSRLTVHLDKACFQVPRIRNRHDARAVEADPARNGT